MNDELAKQYYVLGLRPGASPTDLKAAHRDLAKVWHPDRFLHDPQLRQKAEQKLKEINEAYDQLRSGKARRQPATTSHRQHYSSRDVSRARKIRWRLVLAPVLIFAAVFLVSRSLLQTRERVDENAIPAIREAQPTLISEAELATNRERLAKTLSEKDRVETKPQREDLSAVRAAEPNLASVQPVSTVTVVIDPSTGKLARAHCPMKTSMTYPRGTEPREYCPHRATVPPLETTGGSKESRVKSVAKRLLLQQ